MGDSRGNDVYVDYVPGATSYMYYDRQWVDE